MPNNDQPSERMQAKSFLGEALCDACDKAWASHEEITVIAQHGIKAIPEADRDRILRAIAANIEGAAAAFDLANIPENEFALDPTEGSLPTPQELSSQNSPTFQRLAMPTWGLAASVMLVSGVGLLLENGSGSQSGSTGSYSTQSQSANNPSGPIEGDQGFDSTFLISVFLVAFVGTLILTPFIWKKFRNSTR